MQPKNSRKSSNPKNSSNIDKVSGTIEVPKGELPKSSGNVTHGQDLIPNLLIDASTIGHEFPVFKQAFSNKAVDILPYALSRSPSVLSFSIPPGEHLPADALDDEVAKSIEAVDRLSYALSRSPLVLSFSITPGDYPPSDALDDEVTKFTKEAANSDVSHCSSSYVNDWGLITPEGCKIPFYQNYKRIVIGKSTGVKGNYSTPPSIVFEDVDIWVNASQTVARKVVTMGQESPELLTPNQGTTGLEDKYGSPPPSIVFDDVDIWVNASQTVASKVTTTSNQGSTGVKGNYSPPPSIVFDDIKEDLGEVATAAAWKPKSLLPNQVPSDASSFAEQVTDARLKHNKITNPPNCSHH